ncbi:hypothetical protein [Burkholderia cepacia]|uniref:Uncharacterized protein n=1 Tax=Burkholderia cepacia TaxID=292 RepID=A0A8I1B606_BURCE|nr:hypothetical protein [Burkholderia cepacia]MBH9701924.1 hypothetical protein [Burkholderia cepacia]MBH9717909.1 hypothetical protein [Burkholderia cepacia]MBX3764250.1 hypothetical protein [Burkholderia cepacia]MBX3802864.1 hypothetical protein [Burkholderia cepacia]MBX3912114.1 hypothetical protein [Burkholderia cepacia]
MIDPGISRSGPPAWPPPLLDNLIRRLIFELNKVRQSFKTRTGTNDYFSENYACSENSSQVMVDREPRDPGLFKR